MPDPVTIRYAEALFNLAKSGGKLEEVKKDVERFDAELQRPGVATFVFDARVSVDTRREKIQPFFQGATKLFHDFANLLFDKRREEVLRNLGAAFHRRVLQVTPRPAGLPPTPGQRIGGQRLHRPREPLRLAVILRPQPAEDPAAEEADAQAADGARPSSGSSRASGAPRPSSPPRRSRPREGRARAARPLLFAID